MKRNTRAKIISSLRKKSIAVGSGKGGVGKSTTSLNLAVYYARLGIKVGLCDIDPLSNIATILDLDEERLTSTRDDIAEDGAGLASYVLPVFTNLDLLFPRPKLKRGESARLLSRLFSTFAAELDGRYDLLIYDLPAGIGEEENLAFLPFTDNLLVVTNSEPTSHVSAGGYIKSVLETVPDIRIYFWHNKYALVQDSGFNPRHVIDNYNRHVQEELRIDRRNLRTVRDIAFIPHDPSLDLLQSALSLEGSSRLKLLETCEVLQKKLLSGIPDNLDLDDNGRNLVKYYIARQGRISRVEDFSRELEEYYLNFYRSTGSPGIGKFLAKKKMNALSDENRGRLRKYVKAVRGNALRERTLKTRGILAGSLEELKDSTRMFGAAVSPQTEKIIHENVLKLLKEGSAVYKNLDPFERNILGLMLFYFSLSKIMNSHSVQKLIFDFVPKRKNTRGALVRDKNRQIHYLVERDELYHAKYFALIKTLFPVVLRQLSALVDSFGLGSLVLRMPGGGEFNRNAYLKLLTNFVHDAIHAGLGVFIGFKFNTASESIKKGAKELIQEIGLSNRELPAS